MVRACGRRRGADCVCGVGGVRPRTTFCLRSSGCGHGIDHCLPVRARPGNTDVDHGGGRPRRVCGHPCQKRRSARTHGEGRHAGCRQDRHADARQAHSHRRRSSAAFRRKHPVALCRKRRAQQRASAGRSNRHRGSGPPYRALPHQRLRRALGQRCDRHGRTPPCRPRQRQFPFRAGHRNECDGDRGRELYATTAAR